MNENRPTGKINIFALRRFLVTLFFVVLAGTGGYLVGSSRVKISAQDFPQVDISREQPAEHQDVDFSLFWRVWDTVSASYFDKSKLEASKMVYGAIKGMVAAVGDPYTAFLPPVENKVVQEDLSGNFNGVGIQIGYKGSRLAVIAPLPDSPAEQAGIQAGDLIAGIIDEEKNVDMGTVGVTLPEAVQVIRGPKGSTVTLLIIREGEEQPLEYELRREEIEVPSIIVNYVGENENTAHVEVVKFVAETQDEWDDAVIEVLKRPNIENIVIDVRNNPGGYMQAAVDLASDFVDQGEVVVIQENSDGTKEHYSSQRLPRLQDYNTVVLVNEGSASASEILAGALRDQEDIQLIGTVTFGKGTIQESMQINGGSGLHITTARWLTPSEFWVNEVGLTPDVEVEDNVDTTEDEVLQSALERLN